MQVPNCIFCKISQHQSPAAIVYEDGGFVAIKDIRPEAPTHILVLPKQHVEKVTDMDLNSEGFRAFFAVCVKVAKQLGVEQACKFAVNNGKDAGQIVPHAHIHILSQLEARSESATKLKGIRAKGRKSFS